MNKKRLFATVGLCALSALCIATAVACAPKEEPTEPEEPETNKFETYTKSDWLSESFEGKTISYQFVGDWEMGVASYSMDFAFMVNLYSDGSVLMEQMNIYSVSGYMYYGYWNGNEDADGKYIEWATSFMTNVDGSLINAEYDYTFYEKSDGTYSSGIKFCMAPGQYVRDATVSGGSTVVYATSEDFHNAKKKVVEEATFTGSNAAGPTATVVIMSDYTATITLTMEVGGTPTAVYNAEGVIEPHIENLSITGYTMTITHGEDEPVVVDIPAENDTYGDFTLTISLMGNSLTFEMTSAAAE